MHVWTFSAVDTSADQAMIHLLAGLEDDGYQMRGHRTLPHHHSLGNFRNSQNSDDEENEPQVEKEEIELSLLMSQRWDSSIEEPGAKRRYIFDIRGRRYGAFPPPLFFFLFEVFIFSSW